MESSFKIQTPFDMLLGANFIHVFALLCQICHITSLQILNDFVSLCEFSNVSCLSENGCLEAVIIIFLQTKESLVMRHVAN
jgi:hypothetical protein